MVKPHTPVEVRMSGFPHITFHDTALPVDSMVDDKGGKVCKNLKEAKKYAGQQFERLITQELNMLYAFKKNIADSTVNAQNEN